MRKPANPAPQIDESLEPLAEQLLDGAGFHLRFPEPLESRYWQDTSPARASDMRSFTRFTVLLYLAVIILLSAAFHGFHNLTNFLAHAGTTILVALLAYPSLQTNVPTKRRMTAFFLLCVAFAVIPILFAWLEPDGPSFDQLVVCALPISFLLLFGRLPFPLGALLAVVTIASYSVMILLLVPLPPGAEPPYLISLVVLQAVPALIAVQSMERSARRVYLRNLLERISYERALAHNSVLTTLSYTDPLTGIANRRRMDAELARLCDQEDVCASFLIMDIDWFKGFNDHYGHQVGDRVLQEVANCLAAALREGDLLGRMGGEEFGVLLPGIVMQEAVLVAERLRLAVASFPFMVGTQLIKITISVGVSSIVPHDEPERVVAAADKALYRAKQAGRNQVGGPWLKQFPEGLA